MQLPTLHCTTTYRKMTFDFVQRGTESIRIARAADFFHIYPRIQFGNTELKLFSLQSDYLTAIKFQALPYLLVGVVLVLAAVVFNTYRYFRRGLSPGADDTKDSEPGKRDTTAKAYVLFSAFLHVCILLLIGIAASANTTVRQSVDIASLSIASLRNEIDVNLVKPASFYGHWATMVQNVKEDRRKNEPERTAYALLTVNLKAFLKTQKASEATYQDLVEMDEYLNSTSIGMYYGITAILLVFIAGCFLMYFSDVAPPRAHKVRMLMIVFFAVPLGASWGLVGFSTVVGQAAGDFCYALKEYQHSVAWTASVLPTSSQFPVTPENMFIKSDLQCPTSTKISNDIKKLHQFYNLSKSNVFLNGIAKFDIRKGSRDEWKNTLLWSLDSMRRYRKCTAHMKFGGTLSYNICGDHNHSAVSAMALLWLSSVGLSMLFGVLVFISSLGQPPAEFATAYEMLHLFGAPKLMRAFGDYADPGGFIYTSALERRESLQSRDTNHGTLHVTKSVAEAFTDCAIQVEDDYMVRVSTNPLTRKRSTSLLRRVSSNFMETSLDRDHIKKPKSRERSTGSHARWFFRRRSDDMPQVGEVRQVRLVEVEEPMVTAVAPSNVNRDAGPSNAPTQMNFPRSVNNGENPVQIVPSQDPEPTPSSNEGSRNSGGQEADRRGNNSNQNNDNKSTGQ